MPRYLALLRAVNVGGRKLVMSELRTCLAEAGYRDVTTYIQSGNVIFSDDRLDPDEIAVGLDTLIEGEFSLAVDSVVVSRDALAIAIDRNPYPTESGSRMLHLLFCRAPVSVEAQTRINEIVDRATAKGSDDRATVDGKVVYLSTPSGFGRSELAAAIVRPGGSRPLTGTARNWATVHALLALCDEVASGR